MSWYVHGLTPIYTEGLTKTRYDWQQPTAQLLTDFPQPAHEQFERTNEDNGVFRGFWVLLMLTAVLLDSKTPAIRPTSRESDCWARPMGPFFSYADYLRPCLSGVKECMRVQCVKVSPSQTSEWRIKERQPVLGIFTSRSFGAVLDGKKLSGK